MKDYSNYQEADCCTSNNELRYKTVKSCSLVNSGECEEVYLDKLTNEIIYDVTTIDLCALIAPIPDDTPLYPVLDPLTIDPQYTPSEFNKKRIAVAEKLEDWELTNTFDRIGNKFGRWFLNGYNLTREDLYKLNAINQTQNQTRL